MSRGARIALELLGPPMVASTLVTVAAMVLMLAEPSPASLRSAP